MKNTFASLGVSVVELPCLLVIPRANDTHLVFARCYKAGFLGQFALGKDAFSLKETIWQASTIEVEIATAMLGPEIKQRFKHYSYPH